MKKVYIPIIAVAGGFGSAFLAFYLHNVFFVLLPVWAFLFGYLTSWRSGLLSGFLLFLGYTAAVSLMARDSRLEPVDFIYNFMAGGFVFPLLGATAPLIRQGIRRAPGAIALVVLAAAVSWSVYLAVPRYGYYYQVIIESEQNLDNLELYLPIPSRSGEPYQEIFDYPLRDAGLTDDYALNVIDTEYGTMAKVQISSLMEKYRPSPAPPGGPPAPTPANPVPSSYYYPYIGNIIFMQPGTTSERLELGDKVDIQRIDRELSASRFRSTRLVQEFEVPLKIIAEKEANIALRLENRTDWGEAIHFVNTKYGSLSERVKLDGATNSSWVFAGGEAVSTVGISAPD